MLRVHAFLDTQAAWEVVAFLIFAKLPVAHHPPLKFLLLFVGLFVIVPLCNIAKWSPWVRLMLLGDLLVLCLKFVDQRVKLLG